MRTVKLLPVFCIPVLLASSAMDARAERRNPLAGKPAIMHRVEMRKLRFEITPEFITSTNQDYRYAFGPGVNLQFHLFDWLGIGVQGGYFFNANTPLENSVRGQLPDESQGAMYQYPGPQPTLQIHDQRVLNLKAAASAYLSITPWAGKFALFSAAFARYDFFVQLGGGIVYYTQNNCCSDLAMHPDPSKGETLPDPNTQNPTLFAGAKGAGMIGVGVHIYFNDWFGMQLELRDYFAKANPGGLDTNGDRKLTSDDETIQNNLFFGAGITIMLPPTAKISE